jgi:hypothetical protein
VENTLAYCRKELITTVKSFTIQAACVIVTTSMAMKFQGIQEMAQSFVNLLSLLYLKQLSGN